MKAAAAQYSATHPDVTISISGGGSGSGITQVAAGAIDIGDSDIPAPGAVGLHDHRVAVVGSGVILHPSLRMRSLSRADLAGIFSGRIANWREVGGPDLVIIVVNRPRSSGTRAVFRRTVMQGEQIADSALTVDASGTVVATVATTPGAISYVALSALAHSPLKPIAIDGIRPIKANIVNGRYPLWAYEHLFTGELQARLEDFIAAVARNRKLLAELHYIPLDDMRVVKNDR
jgi:phosphate transport system substrate-binding protein